jgi:hypothetical protein
MSTHCIYVFCMDAKTNDYFYDTDILLTVQCEQNI